MLFEGVPAMYSMFSPAKELGAADLSWLTRCTVGGQTISLSVIDRWQRRTGAPLIELWGMTEIAGLGTTHALNAPPVPGSIGVSLPGIEVRVADLADVRQDDPAGEPGELMVRGPHNVYPAEIERVLAGHPAVAMVAVGPVPDEVKAGLACAYIVLADGAAVSEDELVAYAGERLAAYKRPRLIRFVETLPATSTGKLMRRELIKQFTMSGPGGDVTKVHRLSGGHIELVTHAHLRRRDSCRGRRPAAGHEERRQVPGLADADTAGAYGQVVKDASGTAGRPPPVRTRCCPRECEVLRTCPT